MVRHGFPVLSYYFFPLLPLPSLSSPFFRFERVLDLHRLTFSFEWVWLVFTFSGEVSFFSVPQTQLKEYFFHVLCTGSLFIRRFFQMYRVYGVQIQSGARVEGPRTPTRCPPRTSLPRRNDWRHFVFPRDSRRRLINPTEDPTPGRLSVVDVKSPRGPGLMRDSQTWTDDQLLQKVVGTWGSGLRNQERKSFQFVKPFPLRGP